LNLGYFSCFTPICLCGESRLLVSWCVCGMCNMTGSDKDLGGQTIGRSGDAVCGLHRAHGDEWFLIEPQNHGPRIF
jgi:hypothetical protein